MEVEEEPEEEGFAAAVSGRKASDHGRGTGYRELASVGVEGPGDLAWLLPGPEEVDATVT